MGENILEQSTRNDQREDDVIDSWLPHFFSDYDKSSSMHCTLMTENECWISFNVVGGETGIMAYNLQIYGKS